MRTPEIDRRMIVAAMLVAASLSAFAVHAAAPSPANAAAVATQDTAPSENRWFVRVGAIAALYNSSATIAMAGQNIPGATAYARNNVTPILDVGFDMTKSFAVVMMSGIPPRTAVDGRGTVSALGNLGAVRFGPIFLTGLYRFPEVVGLRPYFGAGVAEALILKNYDGAVSGLKVHDNSGFVLQAGVEYQFSPSWAAFVDYKRLWLALNANGALESAPINARVTLNPNLVSAGVRFSF